METDAFVGASPLRIYGDLYLKNSAKFRHETIDTAQEM
jgi:hypothetical protein